MRNIQNCSGQFCQPASNCLDNIQSSFPPNYQSALSSQFSDFSVAQRFQLVFNSTFQLLFYPFSNENSDFSPCISEEQSKKLQITFRKGIRFNQKQRLRLKKRPAKRSEKLSNSCSAFTVVSSKVLFTLAPLLLLSYSFNTQALSASTANTIEGTKPYFMLNGSKLASTKDLVGFSYPDSSVAGGVVKIDSTKSVEVNSANVVRIPSSVKENDIVTAVAFSNPPVASSLDTLVKTSTHPLKVGDGDGDAPALANIGAKGTISVVMKKDGSMITPGSNPLSLCSDYSIQITVAQSGIPSSVMAITTYGAPNNSQTDYSATVATYNLRSKNASICYLAPADLTVNPSTAFASLGVNYPSNVGYTSLWEGTTTADSKGFKVRDMVSSGNKFPQTGFKGAVFTVVGGGNDQSDYECKVTPTTGVTQSPSIATSTVGKNCTIEYTSLAKPTAGITISLYETSISTTTAVDTYTTPIPQLWAKIKSHVKYNTAQNFSGTYSAAIACGASASLAGTGNKATAATYFFSRRELTNAVTATAPPNGSSLGFPSYFIRDVSSTAPAILAEWGDVSSNSPYPNSGLSLNSGIWAKEASWSANTQQSVYPNGMVFYNFYPTGMQLAVCR